jgi:pimeloyl-ACP methyl ester carboxylesterase
MKARILYVPIFLAAESERFAATVDDWAVVESFDVPDGRQAEGAIERLDALGWADCLVVADSQAQRLAVEVALIHPDRVRGVALSHAVARYRVSQPRAALHPEVLEAVGRLLETDYMAFWRAVTQLTQGGMPDAWVERWAAAVPPERVKRLFHALVETEPPLAERLVDFDGPVLLAGHRNCVLWTPEGFEDAVAALPASRAIRCDDIPVFDPSFGAALKELAAG